MNLSRMSWQLEIVTKMEVLLVNRRYMSSGPLASSHLNVFSVPLVAIISYNCNNTHVHVFIHDYEC